MDKKFDVLFTLPGQSVSINESRLPQPDIGGKPTLGLDNLYLESSEPGRYLVYKNTETKGGLASIYHGFDTKLERDVAVKVLRPKWGDFDDLNDELELEAKSQARLTHRNIVVIHDIVHTVVPGQSGIKNLLILEWLDPSEFALLKSLSLKDQSLDTQSLIRISRGCADAIDFMAKNNFTHRDIKPGNIFFSKDEVKVGDLGTGKWFGAIGEDADATGTPAYMSPEHILKQKLDVRSDIFSLASTLYTAISGTPPYSNDSVADIISDVLNKPYPPLLGNAACSGIDPDILLRMDKVLSKAMEKDPEDRYQNASIFADAVENALSPYVDQQWLKEFRYVK